MQNKKINFHYIDVRFYFQHREMIKEFILQLFNKENKKLDVVNYIFCTDNYLFKLNLEYLKHDTYTDIITFFYSEKGDPIVSDIYISVERVRENAKKFQTTFKHELMRVILHGALHLCGYKDKTEAEQAKMRAMEELYLNNFQL